MNRFIPIILVVLLVVGGGWLFLKSETSSSNPQDQVAESRVVVGGDGKEITIPSRPKRVVIISTSHLDLYLAAGGENTVVGRVDSPMIPKEQLDKIKNAENVGSASLVSLEKVMELKPDLVIGSEVAFQRQLEGPLKQAGIPLLLIKTQSVEDNIQAIRLFGDLTGHKEFADQKIQAIHNVSAEIQKRKGDQKAPRVLIVFGTPESFVFALPNSFPGNLLTLAGGENIAKDLAPIGSGMAGSSYAPFSLEFAIDSKPDRILFITHGDPEIMIHRFKEMLKENAAWASIPAIQEERLDIFPFEMAINPGAQTGKSLRYLGNILYPEAK